MNLGSQTRFDVVVLSSKLPVAGMTGFLETELLMYPSNGVY
jgi:hypothetical protein